ncbi:GNAT family N-acetyltransferase [Candidatus Pelagibacter bacterium]|nr:GNAT family N-acetyltransferase [Candidatus Pelagibacter bacterium]MDA8845088.1 GNAT family N-acetyltransferase [Candidatus Pelagibacter bacterium]
MINKEIDRSQMYVDVAKLHIDCIKKGFLPSLGVKFLALLYRCIDESDFSTLIVKYKDCQLIGFVTGTLDHSNLYKKMFSYPLDLFIALIPIVFNVKKIIKVIDIRKHMSGSKRSKYSKAELLTICVHPDHRQQGIAVDLYEKLSNYFRSVFVYEFVIIVGQSLKANLFYKKRGVELVDEIQVHPNINSNLYIQKL